jgi:hypothetical protein
MELILIHLYPTAREADLLGEPHPRSPTQPPLKAGLPDGQKQTIILPKLSLDTEREERF